MLIQFMENKHVEYSFVDNGILLTTDEIKKDGFREIWRQQSNNHSIQILCYKEYQYKEDLWTPIILHYSDCYEKPYIFQTMNRRKLMKLLRKAENKNE